MITRINVSILSFAVAGLIAACSPSGNDNNAATLRGDTPTISPTNGVPPTGAQPNRAPDAAPIGVLPTLTDRQMIARAELRPTQGNTAMGTISFARDGDTLTMQVALTGVTPGPHGIHIHENGDCSAPDASSAGEHFNPEGRPHGGLSTPVTERHPGDLGNVTAKDTGDVEETVTSDTLVKDGQFTMVGKAIVIHEGVDDERSQPSGDSGDPAACGVIMAVPPGQSGHLG